MRWGRWAYGQSGGSFPTFPSQLASGDTSSARPQPCLSFTLWAIVCSENSFLTGLFEASTGQNWQNALSVWVDRPPSQPVRPGTPRVTRNSKAHVLGPARRSRDVHMVQGRNRADFTWIAPLFPFMERHMNERCFPSSNQCFWRLADESKSLALEVIGKMTRWHMNLSQHFIWLYFPWETCFTQTFGDENKVPCWYFFFFFPYCGLSRELYCRQKPASKGQRQQSQMITPYKNVSGITWLNCDSTNYRWMQKQKNQKQKTHYTLYIQIPQILPNSLDQFHMFTETSCCFFHFIPWEMGLG